MTNYIIKTPQQLVRLNELLYFHLVTEDGVNFKFPYRDGTVRYISPLDAEGTVCKVYPEMLQLAENIPEVANLIGNQFYTYAELIQSGKIVE